MIVIMTIMIVMILVIVMMMAMMIITILGRMIFKSVLYHDTLIVLIVILPFLINRKNSNSHLENKQI